ncbi:hypothetical protein BHE74_00003078 [Ensete ventricosum]|nr:hypothetical protein BHE74_00003078 [Ensete ventricosum]
MLSRITSRAPARSDHHPSPYSLRSTLGYRTRPVHLSSSRSIRSFPEPPLGQINSCSAGSVPELLLDQIITRAPASSDQLPSTELGQSASRAPARSDHFSSHRSVGSSPEPLLARINSRVQNLASPPHELPLGRIISRATARSDHFPSPCLVRSTHVRSDQPAFETSLTSLQPDGSTQDLIFGTLIGNLEKVRWGRSTCPSCRKHDVRLAARTTDGVVNYNGMVSDREGEDLRHGGRPCLLDRHKNFTQSGRDKLAGSPGPGIISTGTAAVFLV